MSRRQRMHVLFALGLIFVIGATVLAICGHSVMGVLYALAFLVVQWRLLGEIHR